MNPRQVQSNQLGSLMNKLCMQARKHRKQEAKFSEEFSEVLQMDNLDVSEEGGSRQKLGKMPHMVTEFGDFQTHDSIHPNLF